jgi:S-formylglutathione hydrolase FrmB
MRTLLRIALLLVLASTASLAQSRVDCNALKSPILHKAIHYCVLLPDSYEKSPTTRYSVLYFLHGLGDNEQTLINTGTWDVIETLRNQHKIGDFIIVTPEGDHSFYINSADGDFRYGDFFLREFMPYIEHTYRVLPGRNHRGVTGMSMGGYGALRFAFAYPALFGSVSAQSAALITESRQQVNDELTDESPLGELLGDVFGDPISASYWAANNPFDLARKNHDELRNTAIYFNCGRNDSYGFEKGASALDRQLTREGIKHEFHLYPGAHSLQYFLTHISETFEFHSRVFDTGSAPSHGEPAK